MELKFKMILSSVVTLSIAVATSFVLTKFMLKGTEARITNDLNKNIIEKIKEVRAEITSLDEKLEEHKIKSKIPDNDNEGLNDLIKAKSEEIKNTLSSINLKLKDLNQKVNLDKDSIDDGANGADASSKIKGNGDNDNGGKRSKFFGIF